MSSGFRNVDTARSNAIMIVDICEQKLEDSGFIHRAKTTLWRRTNSKFDILKINIVPKRICEKWQVPNGSISLDPSCLFPFLPRLGHVRTNKAVRPEDGFGQLRLAVNKGISQRTVKAPNIWWAGDDAHVFELVVKDVLGKITDTALPFFRRFEDLGELMRTLLEDEDAVGTEGVWEFGKKGSPSRLLYTAFAAIECGEWELAAASLRACREKIMMIPEPIGRRVQAKFLPYIEEGLNCSNHRSTWSLV
jgi:hypothetical protein